MAGDNKEIGCKSLDLNWVPMAVLILMVGGYCISELWIGHIEKMANCQEHNTTLQARH